MTEGKKRCDLCKIYICDNSSSIRRHERTLRHKDNVTNKNNVTKKLSNIREKKVAKDKEKQKTARALTQIKKKVSRSREKDITSIQQAKDTNANSLETSGEGIDEASTMFGDWECDMSSGYYYNQTNGCYFDPNSGFFYTDALGKWLTLKEVLAAAPKLSSKPKKKKPNFAMSTLTSISQTKIKSLSEIGQPRKVNVAKDKEINETARLLTLIKEKEKENCSGYENEKLSFEKARDSSNATSLGDSSSQGIDASSSMFGDWEIDMSSGYYYNLINGCYFDPNSGLYYPHDLGKWVTLKEALVVTPKLPSKSQSQPSSVHIKNRKRPNSKPKVVSEEEAAALKAREVERKRVEEREKYGKLPIRFTYSRKRKN